MGIKKTLGLGVASAALGLSLIGGAPSLTSAPQQPARQPSRQAR